MNDIVQKWEPKTLDEAHFATNVSIALKDIAGRYLLPNEVRNFIGRAIVRDETSVRLRFHTEIIEHFSLNPITDQEKIKKALDLISEMEEDRRKK